MKDLFLKSWKTTLVGLIVICYYGYKLVILKQEINPSEIVSVLFAAGFLVAKDGSASHTKK